MNSWMRWKNDEAKAEYVLVMTALLQRVRNGLHVTSRLTIVRKYIP